MNPISHYSEQARSQTLEAAWRSSKGLQLSIYSSLALLVLIVAGFLGAKRSPRPQAATVPEAVPAATVQQNDSPLVQEVDFRRQILPILTEHCIRCHGPEKRRSGLLLTSSKAALAPADSGLPAIVPGQGDKSELIRRVVATDAEKRMPPGDHPLSAEQIDLLRAWIDQGAVWPGDPAATTNHWAFKKPIRPALPAVAFRDSAAKPN
ncbi:MAG: c-type cytochrome domain-containing protein [Gemmataceae bacterium]